MFYMYVLQSTVDGTTYIGSSENVEKRLIEHNAGKTKSIKHKTPMEVVYYEAYLTKTLAIKREIFLKKNSAAKAELYKRIFE